MSSRRVSRVDADDASLGAAVASYMSCLQLQSVAHVELDTLRNERSPFEVDLLVDGSVRRTAQVCEIIGSGALLLFSEHRPDAEEDELYCEYYAAYKSDFPDSLWEVSTTVYWGDDSVWVANEAAMALAERVFPLASPD